MTKEVFSRVLDYNTGLTGASVLSALTIKYGAFQGFICQDYTVVQVITDAQGNDVTAQMGLRGVTLSPGIYISMASGDSIYSIILSSGSVILYDLGADMSSVPGVSDLITAFSTRATVDGATLESTSCINGPLMPYFKKASFYLTPSAYKGGKLYAQKPITGNGDLTWTRGSDAFRTNSSGLVQRVPLNLLSYSEDLTNASWSKTSTTITTNSTTSPNGTTTADTLLLTGTSSLLRSISQSSAGGNSLTNTFSVYVKYIDRPFIQLVWGTGFSTTNYANFNIQSGSVTAGTYTDATIVNAGDGWYRLTITTLGTSTTPIIYIWPIDSSTASRASASSGGGSYYIWGAQLVEGTSAQTYLPTTDRLGFPRLDYTYGSCPSALLEPQRTNTYLRSEDFTQAIWTKGNASITANNTSSPDGNNNGTLYSANGTSGVKGLTQTIAFTTGITYTISAYAKKGSNNFLQITTATTFMGTNVFANFDLNNGVLGSVGSSNVGASITNVGNGWYRCVLTGTATTTTTGASGFYIVSSSTSSRAESNTLNTDVYIWGAQCEAGSFQTTYIQTTSATATRIADTFSRSNIYTNGLISASGGTWFVELRGNAAMTRDSSARLGIGDITGLNQNSFFLLPSASGNRYSINKSISGTVTTLYQTITDTVKIAIKWNGSTADVFVNGTKQVSATAFATTLMEFFNLTAGTSPTFIQQMALFPAPLTDTECAAMTTI